MSSLRVISDAPADLKNDLLNFKRYVDPIVDILSNSQTETPFTLGIFGTWGSGKSTLLRMVDEKLESAHKQDFVRVHFNPWVYRSEENMLVPLLHTLNDTLDTEKARFGNALINIGKILAILGSDIVIKKLTADVLSMEKITDATKTVLAETGKVESGMRNLRNSLQEVANSVYENGAQLVFFIDDLDRCQPDQIIDLLDSLNLFLDLQHAFILLAVDKEVVDLGIQVKYSKFNFAGGREKVVGAEYLEKMVQLPLSLYPLQDQQVGAYINQHNPSQLVIDHLILLQTILQPNPRKIKRVLNILNVTDAISTAMPGLNLKPDLVARLVVLQVQSAELYQDVISIPELLVALEGLYQGHKKLNQPADFAQFLQLQDKVVELSKKYFQPGTYLGKLFTASSFNDELDKLPAYLSMLGG